MVEVEVKTEHLRKLFSTIISILSGKFNLVIISLKKFYVNINIFYTKKISKNQNPRLPSIHGPPDSNSETSGVVYKSGTSHISDNGDTGRSNVESLFSLL